MISSIKLLTAAWNIGNYQSIDSSHQSDNNSVNGKTRSTEAYSLELSTTADLMKIGNLKLPTVETVRELSAELSSDLKTFFRQKGISTEPPVEFGYDYNNDRVWVIGNRSDAKKIEDALNSSEAMKEKIRTLSAVSSQVYQIQESLNFQKEYRASSNPQVVVAKYSHLFNNNHSSTVTMSMGSSLGISVNGRNWDYMNIEPELPTVSADEMNIVEELYGEDSIEDERSGPPESAPDISLKFGST